MAYLIYGKRTCLVNGGGPDKKFAALDAKGHRVTKLADAMSYAEKKMLKPSLIKWALMVVNLKSVRLNNV